MSENCPKCGGPGPLQKIEAGLRVALESTGQAAGLPSAVCANCLDGFSGQVSQGVKLRMEEEAKQKNKIQLWKNRVSYVKQGRQFMQQKAMPEAAMCFEKYLKILEMVYEPGPAGLNPEIFSNSKRSKEMTVIVSVYWDLIRIYDSNKRYSKRLNKAVTKLLLFGKYSSIFPNIVKKAESYVRSAKNPPEIKRIIKAGKSGKGCWIATVTYGDPNRPEVQRLRALRDQKLEPHLLGQCFIKFYYFTSPFIARVIEKNNTLKIISKFFLNQIIKKISK